MRMRWFPILILILASTMPSIHDARSQDIESEARMQSLNESAEASFRAGDMPGAVKFAEEAYRLIKRNDLLNITPNAMRARSNYIALSDILGNAYETSSAITEVIDLWNRSGQRREPIYFDYKIKLAVAKVSMNQHQAAGEIISIFDGKSAADFGLPVTGDFLLGIVRASVFFAAGLPDKANEALDRIEPLVERMQGPDKAKAADGLASLRVGVYVSQQNIASAVPLLEQLIERQPTTLDIKTINSFKNLLSLGYMYAEQTEKASSVNKDVLDFAAAKLTRDDPIAVSAIEVKALILHLQGRYLDAQEAFNDVLSRVGSNLGLLQDDTLTTFGQFFLAVGKFSEAEELFRRAYQGARAFGDDSPKALSTANKLAAFYVSRGRLADAEPIIVDAFGRSLRALGSKHWLTPEIWRTYASFLRRNGDLFGARTVIERALRMSEELKGPADEATLASMNGLVYLLEAEGKFDEAETVLRKVMTIRAESGNTIADSSFTTENNLGWVLYRAGKLSEAESLLEVAARGRSQVLGATHPFTVLSRNNLATVKATLGKVDEAVEIVSAEVSSLLRWSDLEIESASDSSSRINALASARDAVGLIFSLAAKKPTDKTSESAAFVALNSQGSLASRSGAILRTARDSLSQEDRQLFDSYIEARDDLAYAYRTNLYPVTDSIYSQGNRSAARSETAVSQAAENVARLERELASRTRSFRAEKLQGFVSPSDIAASLAGNEVLLQYVIFDAQSFEAKPRTERHVGIAVIGSNAPATFRDLGALSEVLPKISDLNAELGADDLGSLASADLFERLIAPVEKELAGKSSIYLVPTGGLSSIPFELLKTRSGEHLMNKFELRYVSSARALLHRAVPSAPKGTLSIFGGSNFDFAEDRAGASKVAASSEKLTFNKLSTEAAQSYSSTLRGSALLRFEYLSGTLDEADDIAKIWREGTGGTVSAFTGEGASESNLKNLNSPSVLHLATHGFVTRDRSVPSGEMSALLSGIALRGANLGSSTSLQDGVVYGYEIEALDLAQTELVVVSACDSGSGISDLFEGTYSLARAFQLAGVKSTLVTRRQVDDRLTREFMKEFYLQWLSSKTSPAKALQKIKAIWASGDNQERSDPRIWAPFYLVEN